MSIFDQVKDFSVPLLERWRVNQPKQYDASAIQQQYLFSMAWGSLRSSQSFAILEQANAFHDLPAIARILLERYVRADFARRSNANAVALMVSECREQIEKLKKLRDFPSSNDEGIQAKIERLEEDVAEITKIGPSEFPRIGNVYQIFELCDLQKVYRSAYYLLSQQVHGSFRSGFEEVTIDEVMRFLMLMVPVETSNFLNMVSFGDAAEGFLDLRENILSVAFGPSVNKSA